MDRYMSLERARVKLPTRRGCGGTWRQDGRGRVLTRRGHFPHVGEGELFKVDEVFRVKLLGHAGSLNGERDAQKSRRR